MITVSERPSLARRTTLGIGGTALAEIELHTDTDCFELDAELKKRGGKPYLLGAGTNILADDGELPFVLVRPLIRTEPSIINEDNNNVYVHVGAGIRLPSLLKFCAEKGLGGLEGLSGIPGSVGGAVRMNAGSYGTETCARLCDLDIYQPSLGIQRVSASQIQYSYRRFSFINNLEDFIILGAIFGLTRKETGGINEEMNLNFFKKKSTQPVTARSAGCVFKNPPGEYSAGRLLERAGFKGKTCGGMAFSGVHANFLVNKGGGSAREAFELIALAREAVLRQAGVELEMEVRVMTCPSK